MSGLFKFIQVVITAIFIVSLNAPMALAYSEPKDPGAPPDNNKPIDVEGRSVVGELGPGTAGEKCVVPINLDSQKLNNNINFDIPYVPGWLEKRTYRAFAKTQGKNEGIYNDVESGVNSVSGDELCVDGSEPSTTDPTEIENGNCTCMPVTNLAPIDMCYSIEDPDEQSKCTQCSNGGGLRNGKPGVWTAVGCMSYDFDSFIGEVLLKVSISIAGFIALGCIIYSAFILQTSQGNPESIQKARERITSCIIGLLLIIFSIFILEVIGIGFLGLTF